MRLRLALLVCLITMPALAQPSPPPITLQGQSSPNVFIWRDGRAMREGLQLFEAGVHRTNPVMIQQLLSCIVPNGTAIVVSNGGFASSTVLVTTGQQSGCRGDVDNQFIRRPPR